MQQNMQEKFILFQRKSPKYFRQKMAESTKNGDHNIDPWSPDS
jgi:hypothetical protein